MACPGRPHPTTGRRASGRRGRARARPRREIRDRSSLAPAARSRGGGRAPRRHDRRRRRAHRGPRPGVDGRRGVLRSSVPLLGDEPSRDRRARARAPCGRARARPRRAETSARLAHDAPCGAARPGPFRRVAPPRDASGCGRASTTVHRLTPRGLIQRRSAARDDLGVRHRAADRYRLVAASRQRPRRATRRNHVRRAAVLFTARGQCGPRLYRRLVEQQRWSGVRLGDVVGSRAALESATAVEVISVTGHRWSFDRGEAERALLATHIGGEPISTGHGYPVRLVPSGHRGFTWIKWIDEIRVV